MIDQDTIDRIREQNALAVLIGESVKLEKRGRSFVGLCPFHKEKTPSFHVNDDRGFYHCFGCGASGDGIKFIQEQQGLTFVEAVRVLAERAGIEIQDSGDREEQKRRAEARRRREELFEVGNAAAGFFERMLREHPLAHHAREELARRGLPPDTDDPLIREALQQFRVGYAPYGWDGLSTALRKLGFSHHAAEKVGLLAPRRTGAGHFDRFRHRLMFGVLDIQGRVIAMSGRALPEPSEHDLKTAGVKSMGTSGDPPAKYINSPESPVYKKREALFGIFQAKGDIRNKEQCVVVEGNFDVVSLHARGIKNVVAPLGTAFTPEQAKQIKRFAPHVVMLFDGDKAGQRATRAAQQPAKDVGLMIRVASLPEGLDPDDLIRSRGPEGVKRVISASRSMLEYLIDTALAADFTSADAHSRAAKIKAVAELIGAEDDPAVRAMAERHADTIAERLGIADARTFRALSQAVRRALSSPQDAEAPADGRAAPQPPERARTRDRREEISLAILGACLDFPQLLDISEFSDPNLGLTRELVVSIAALHQLRQHGNIENTEEVLASLAASIHPFAARRLAAPRHTKLQDAKSELLENVKKLGKLEHSRQNAELVEELQRAAASGDFEQEIALLREQEDRARKRHGL